MKPLLTKFNLQDGGTVILRSGEKLPENIHGDTVLIIPLHMYIPMEEKHTFVNVTVHKWRDCVDLLRRRNYSQMNVDSLMKSIQDFLPRMDKVYQRKNKKVSYLREWNQFMFRCSLYVCFLKVARNVSVRTLRDVSNFQKFYII